MRKLEEKFRENTTLKYYNENAIIFSATTQIVDFSITQDKFLALLQPNAYILDFGAAARRVTTQEEFNAAFQEALESKTPFVIDAIVDSDDKVWPMVAPGAPINECFDGKDFESKNK